MTHHSPRPGGRSRSLAVLLSVLGLTLGGTVAAAEAVQAAPLTTTDATVPVMIVLDASGSMKQNDAPGVRMDAAKSAVDSLLGSLPPTSTVGLMVYGTGTGSTDSERDAGCRDITTLTPVGPLDAAAMTAQVDTVQASGYTPIGAALRAAADELPVEGPRSIVLVSDGEDTCAPPAPCDVAKELKQQGVDLTVHTIGFKVDDVARQQLACVADATGGTFADATDSAQLQEALRTRVDYALTGYTAQGTPVVGDEQQSESAPLLTPGQYVDTYALGEVDASDAGPGRNGTTKYYTIPVQAGFRPYISATLIPPQDVTRDEMGIKASGVELTLMAKDSTRCADQRDYVVDSTGRLRPSTTVLSGPTVGGPSYSSRCNTEGVQILKVERFGDLLTDRPMTMEIVVRIEPPADASGVPAAFEGTAPALATPVHGTPTPISGGSSFNDAADLISGSTYADTLSTGQSRYYKFPVAWGQRFSYTLSQVGTSTPQVSGYAISWVDVFNPVREGIDVTGPDNGEQWFGSQPGDPFIGSSTAPARYTNRGSGPRNYELDGSYYLRLDADLADESSTAQFLITVVVSGDVEPGPVYQPAGVLTATTGGATSGPTSSPSSSSSSSSSPSSSAPSSSAVTTGTTGSPTTAASTSPSTTAAGVTTGPTSADATLAAQEAKTGTGSAVWIAAVAAGVALVGVLVWRTTRRRPEPPVTPPHW